MPGKPQMIDSELASVFQKLEELRRFKGAPGEFWKHFLDAVARLISADKIVLLAGAGEGATPAWKPLLEWPAQIPPSRMLKVFLSRLQELGDECSRHGGLVLPLDPNLVASGNFIVGVSLPIQVEPGRSHELICLVSEVAEATAREALVRLKLAAQVPGQYQTNLSLQQAAADVEKFASALDLTLLMGSQQRFLAAAMAVCNGIASRHKCSRVSLGFLQRGYVRVKAISRTEKFGKAMVLVQSIEKTMEEAFDQDDEVVWPPPEGANVISRDHESFAREQGVNYLCSVPLRSDGKPAAVLTCERQEAAFTPTELQQLRLVGDIIAEPLIGLQRRDRWFGARALAFIKERAGKLVGPEHTWAKLLTIGIAAALFVLLVVPVPYRVEGNFVLRSDELVHLTAPFDGYISQVFVRPGDHVNAGDKLLALRTDELQLEEAAMVADLTRYHREAEKARAARSFAEMLVNQAMAKQTQARLDLIRYRLAESVIKAPFTGVVIEGDLRDRLGAPVKAADVLMRVARIETLYIEAEVDERDVHQLAGKTNGEIAFLSQPRLKFPVKIVNLEQAAFPRTQGNVFLVRCIPDGGPRSWWRPGMSGVSKFNVGKRTLFWIFTHRTVDFLRMKLWW